MITILVIIQNSRDLQHNSFPYLHSSLTDWGASASPFTFNLSAVLRNWGSWSWATFTSPAYMNSRIAVRCCKQQGVRGFRIKYWDINQKQSWCPNSSMLSLVWKPLYPVPLCTISTCTTMYNYILYLCWPLLHCAQLHPVPVESYKINIR